MSTSHQLSPQVEAVFNDIKQTRQVDEVNQFWKFLAADPATLSRVWQLLKAIMVEPSSLDPLTKELIYIAVSVTNGCDYCVASHTAAARSKGLSDAQFGELQAIIGLANQTNALARGWRVPLDANLQPPTPI